MPQIQEKVCQIASPMDAALEWLNRQNPLRPDWEEIKDEVIPRPFEWILLQNQKRERIAGDREMLSSMNIHEMTAYWADGGGQEEQS